MNARMNAPGFAAGALAVVACLAAAPLVVVHVAEEPIVCRPADAIDSFLRSGLDALAIGDFLVSKSQIGAAR